MFLKRQRAKVHIYTKNEILLQNVINKDFQGYLKPLNFMQSLLGYPKYLIRDNFITPNGRCINILSFTVTCLYCTMIIVRGIITGARANIIFTKQKTETVFSTTKYFNFGLNAFGHLTNLFSHSSHNATNVLLVLKTQDVLNKLTSRRSLRNETIRNWVYSAIFFLIFYSLYGYLDCFHRKFHLVEVFTDFVLFSFYVNVLYAARIIALIRRNVLVWTENLEGMRSKNVKGETQRWTKMFEIYSLIMDSYIIYVKVFQELILYFILDTFLHTLLYIQSWLAYTQTSTSNNDPKYRHFLSATLYIIIIWVLVHFMYISFMARETEQFYIAMENTQTVSSKLLGDRKCSEAERRMHKNIRRLYNSCFAKVNLKGLFDVDGTLTLQLVQVTMANVIVLLQFAFM